MASIGSISFEFNKEPSCTAVAFWLAKTADFNVNRQLDSGWEISIRKSEDLIVARSKSILKREDALKLARNAAEETLDLICFRLNEPILLKPLDDSYLVVETEKHKRKLIYRMPAPWTLKMGPLNITVHDKDGNQIQPIRIKPIWRPVLRYYRLSQTRENMFDAYRYMFLALEALLHSQWPIIKRPREQEVEWLVRAIGELNKKIDLNPFLLAPAADQARAFVRSQYINLRLPLFHAKKSADTLPHEGLSEADLMPAYARLTRLVRHAINELLQLRGQSGEFTNYVFQTGIESLMQTKELFAAFSCDDTPLSIDEEPFSPQGKATIKFEDLQAEPSSNNRKRLVTAKLGLTESTPKGPIHRLGLLTGEKPLLLSTIENALDLDGIDIFQFEIEFSFINGNMPKWT